MATPRARRASQPSVGVRQLRQNLSVYLRRVARGESFQVTDRGNPVAFLGPLADRATPRGRLIAEGRIRPAVRDLTTLGPPLKAPGGVSVSEALEEQRQERL